LELVASLAGKPVGAGTNVQLRQLLREVPGPLGTHDAMQEALVSQWLSWGVASDAASSLAALNDVLLRSPFLTGNSIGAADLVVFVLLCEKGVTDGQSQGFPSLLRWLDTTQHLLRDLVSGPAAELLPAALGSSRKGVATPGIGDRALAGLLASLPRQTGPFAAVATEAVDESRDQKREAPAAGAEETKGNTEQGPSKKAKKEKKEKKAKKAPEPAAEEELLPTVMEIRVGQMIKVWAHPDADKLYCEEIDLGEEGGGVRNIASGLRDFYATADELQGRKVLVVCNLKPKNARGFPSNGMVLCASNKEHTVVKLLEPPEAAQIGERVSFEGLDTQEPFRPNQMSKKKVLEKLGPEMVTDANGVANFRGHVFSVGGGVCQADVPDGMVA